MAITGKRRLFVEYYLGEAKGNATEAARLAGYSWPSEEAYRLLRVPEIAAVIEGRVEEISLTANQVLALLTEHAYATMDDFITIGPDGNPCIDLARAEKLGKLHLVRKLSSNGKGGIDLELVDSQAALALLGKYHRLFTDRVELEETGPVEIRYVNDWRG